MSDPESKPYINIPGWGRYDLPHGAIGASVCHGPWANENIVFYPAITIVVDPKMPPDQAIFAAPTQDGGVSKVTMVNIGVDPAEPGGDFTATYPPGITPPKNPMPGGFSLENFMPGLLPGEAAKVAISRREP